MSARLDARELREKLAAVYQYVQNLYSPIEEGHVDAPVIVLDCFDGLLGTLDEFDRQLTKIDGKTGAVGGELVLAARSPSRTERGQDERNKR